MVQMPNPSKIRADSNGNPKGMVKLEIEDALEDEHGPFSKRPKLACSANQDAYNDVLDEPSPLGLRLRKSPSLLDLIQMKLTQANSDSSKKKESKPGATSSSNERLKASNFPANILRIGNWECVSRYEGDLVAKCYYAKHKLVWEVLDGGLKSKIEIQWSDITAIKATSPEDGPGTLDVVLARPPLFFRETDPQPRKHTLWQATSDFTGGQASIHRRHFLQCPSGLLSKNFEKLVQCDPRLHLLSQQPEIALESLFFEPRCSLFEEQMEGKKPAHIFGNLKDDLEPSFSGFIDPGSPSLSVSNRSEVRDSIGKLPEFNAQSSNIRGGLIQAKERHLSMDTATSSFQQQDPLLHNPNWWDQLNVPGLIRASMSVDDLVNHLGNCISSDPSLHANSLPPKEMLEELAQYLLSDTQGASSAVSDEKSLMARVNSLCCLIQKDGGNNNAVKDDCSDSDDEVEQFDRKDGKRGNDGGSKDEKPAGMSRKDSFGELLMHLPRIASMPQFLFNISEDSENETR
ncbi:hypothetical protein LUZ60_000806 [Juncus effusus]|nr:hypothetical protein LUZ60_000806 [Juncus effusus]